MSHLVGENHICFYSLLRVVAIPVLVTAFQIETVLFPALEMVFKGGPKEFFQVSLLAF